MKPNETLLLSPCPENSRDTRRKKDKSKVIDDGWMVWEAVSKLLIPGTEISLLLVSLRLFHMRDPAPCRLHPQSRECPSWKASDIWHWEWEYRDSKKRHAVHYFIYTVQRTFPSQQGKTLHLHGGAWGWLNVRKRVARGNGKWNLRTIKDCHSLSWKDQIWLIEDMREMMKKGIENKSEDMQRQKESRQN